MAQTTDCLVTTLKNTSGGEKRVSYLPPHGATLANNGEYSFEGDLVSTVRSKSANFVAAKRNVASLVAALAAGDLEIIKTPVPIFFDPTLDNTKQLKVDNGFLLLADPCWLATSSSAAV